MRRHNCREWHEECRTQNKRWWSLRDTTTRTLSLVCGLGELLQKGDVRIRYKGKGGGIRLTLRLYTCEGSKEDSDEHCNDVDSVHVGSEGKNERV